MAMLTRGDVELYYESRGEGAPLLLVAGLASDSLSWQPIITDLAAHYRVIAVDNRGAGRTTPQTAPTTIRAMADDCVALIEHLGLASAHVLGHSMGGFVAQDCAIRYPDKVNALVLAATSSVNSRRNNDLFSDWASALANGADTKAWLRNLFYWLFSTRFFSNDAVVDAAIQYRLRIRIRKARRHSRIRLTRSRHSIRPTISRGFAQIRSSLRARTICCSRSACASALQT